LRIRLDSTHEELLMRAHLRRGRVFPRCGNEFQGIFGATVETAVLALAYVLLGASPVQAGEEARTNRLDTEHLFGFVEGADIGSRGEREFMIDSSTLAGKGSGTFANTATAVEIKYTVFDNFRISTGATLAHYEIAGVTGIRDTSHAALQSLSFDARFRLLDRTQAPFGLTLSISPHWGFADETSGVPTSHSGDDIQILADRELVPDRLAGAVNLLFANDRARLRASNGIEHESLLVAGAALSVQILPGVWLGGETRYLRDYSGAALNVFSGQAVYVGPTVYTRLGQKAFVSAAWDVQIWGGAFAAPGALDLANFQRHQAKLRFGLEF
jgi:hypothetical protein